MPLDEFIELIKLPQSFSYRFTNTYRIRVNVHALNKALYHYFLASSEGDQQVGDVKSIPDFNYVENGYGLLGAANTQSATARLYDYVLGIYPALQAEYGYYYWYYQYNDVYSLDQILSDEFSRLLFADGVDAPEVTGPSNDTELATGDSVMLSWEPVENAEKYVVVLKPQYLWFNAGNVVFLSDTNQVRLSWEDVPYRDSKIEWYVKALSSIDHEGPYVLEPPPDKAPLVYSNVIATPWSESHYIYTASGWDNGFEEQTPILQDNGTLSPTDTLSWGDVPGADAYLVFITDSENQSYVTVTEESQVSPPFADSMDLIDGVTGLVQFEPGENYAYQVCALRVKSGALSFTIDEPSDTSPPTIHPRFQHPSGIMLQSEWSEPLNFQVQ